ncbi:MAG TPA: MopE-related protein, partial [Polyangiaceae bacterium LLY-WYZ-15_(1-7)]|nr:MopE-related protein [Polyangiaceae bacterium LLY-WYZ-15_(1-7)]
MGKRIALACLLTGLLACGDDDGMEMPDAAVGLDAPECSADPDCDDGVFCNGAETCSAGACVAGEPPCMADQSCDEDMDRCVTPCDVADADGDGVDAPECGGADCDDADPNRFPGNVEVCDAEGHDEDCDPETLGPDRDGDGFVSTLCCNGETCGEDCDDFRRYIAPGAPELCDLLDGDCDGSVDEGVAVRGFVDADGDRRGDPEQPIRGCPAADDFAFLGDDCDDTDPSTPGEELIGDEADNDCDGRVDEAETGVRTLWPDGDGDGYGDPEGLTLEGSVAVEGYVPVSGDCDDDDPMVHPGAPERCNGLDDDCDGAADFRIGEGDGEDDDRDGYPDAACDPEGEADCDDRNPDVHPGAEEVCDGVDNDCDAATPAEDACQTVTWYVDADGDGWGDDAGSGMSSDVPLEGYARRAGDCDDEDPSKRPDAYEDCNAEDDDCDGVIDERADRVCGGTNALGACVAGTCERLVCARGYDDCDDMPLDCETPLDGLANCGACGNVCRSGPNTVPACVDQECRFECAPGFGDCNDDLATDGCEANLMTDEANCGRCTAACRDGADATATCSMGACEYACAPGWSDCDMDLGEEGSNFCETRTSRDPFACGDCATSCDAGAPVCVEGSCQGWSFASDGSDGAFAFVPDVVDGTVMTLPSGVHAFDGDVVIPAGTTLRTSGSGVLEIYATGAIRVEGTVDVSGGDGASAGGSDVSYWDCGAGGETGTGVAGVRGGGVAAGGIALPGESRGVSARCGRGGRFGGGGGGDHGERAGGGGGGGPGGGGGGGGLYTDGGAGG